MNAILYDFNYTLANEDSLLEIGVMPKSCSHVAAVAGSGARVVPLLVSQPQMLTCVDRSEQQLILTKLRIEALKLLNRETYLAFLGYPGFTLTPLERKKIFQQLVVSNPEIRALEASLEHAGWSEIIYLGKWEQALIKMSKVVSLLMNDRLIKIENPTEWNEYMRSPMAKLRWYLFLKILGNIACLRSFFYGSRLPKLSVAKSYHEFFSERFHRLLSTHGFKSSFFAHLMLTGRVYSESAFPTETDPHYFERMKEGAKGVSVNYVHGDISQLSNHIKSKVCCVSLSDVPSYLDSLHYNELLFSLKKHMRSGAVIISRYFAYQPSYNLPEDLSLANHQYQKYIDAEGTQFYDVDIFQAQ